MWTSGGFRNLLISKGGRRNALFKLCQTLKRNTQTRSTMSHYGKQHSSVGFNEYEKEYEKFKLVAPEFFNFANDVLEKWALREQNNSDANPAFWLVDDYGKEIIWSFTELITNANRLSNVLNECGVFKGQCVIVVLPRIPEWWLVNIACLKTGTIISPGTTSLSANDLKNRLVASNATCIITVPEVAELVDQISEFAPSLKTKLLVTTEKTKVRNSWLPLDYLMKGASSVFKQNVRTKSDDPMSWFFTSGTTGYPKMTEHSHASYGLAHQITGKYWLDLTQEDVMWNVSDTGWAKSAYSSFFAPWWQGSCVFVHDTQRFDAKKTLEILQKYPISVTCLPPTAYRMIVQENLDGVKFKTLRHCVSAGEPLNPEVIEKWTKETGLCIREGYGQTEMTLSIGTFRCMDVKPGSMGKAAPGYDVQVVNEHGNPVKDGLEGDIGIRYIPERPVGLFTKYVDDEQKTADCYRGDFYLTGDRGYKDEDSYLWFVGRSDDVIISAGYRIGPFEVESALIEHPGVAESAVISSPCEMRGAIVKAFVVLTPCHDEKDKDELTKELQNHVKKHTAPYKYPRKIEFTQSLPKTISGKIRRVELRHKEWNKEEI